MAASPPFLDVIAQMQREGKLPNQLTAQQVAAIAQSLRNYAASVGQVMTQTQLDAIQAAIIAAVQSLANPVEINGVQSGFNPPTARNSIQAVLKKQSLEGLMADHNIDFALNTASNVVTGAAGYVRDGLDQGVVDEYPAWELLRVYAREVPRGFLRGRKGAIIPAPDQDWPSRWLAAGGELHDGRMIALKDDAVWQNLGDGAGGYTDALGNPFPPFAFNSGFDVNNISREECERLGLLAADQPARTPRFDLANLFAPVT